MSVDPVQTLIRGVLTRDAVRLGVGRAVPIDVAALLAEFRIDLEPTSTLGRSVHGHLRRTNGAWRIGVDPDATLARQRFTVAHELGHYLVAARIGYRPGSVRDYWMLERECQAFAAAVLSPRHTVEAVITPRPHSAADVAAAIDRLAASTELALEAAARRIIEILDEPLLVAALDGPEAWHSGRGSAQVAWIHGNYSWHRVRRGERIRRGHPLAEIERAAKALAVGEAVPATLDTRDAWIERRGPLFAWVVGRLAATSAAA